MNRILAIDPGCTESAWLIFENGEIQGFGKVPNEEMLALIQPHNPHYNGGQADHLAVEMVASYGMPVGKDVFETVFWSGRFVEAFSGPHTKVYRKDVKMHLCGSMRAKDSNIRQALIDRFGPQGTKSNPGGTYGISKDVWSALAVAAYYCDVHEKENK